MFCMFEYPKTIWRFQRENSMRNENINSKSIGKKSKAKVKVDSVLHSLSFTDSYAKIFR